ncbi:hypothetical protein [Microbacterium immunditiarum]|uniref:Flagellar biosynthesis/type III secretory pathway M-ring protein FliF/YscJ n=1 Tax=Microbacterium immunditiarum TaxID=337480 RepID=A0A7Y9GQ05_9MICO|nr:hypothetical protein [Microbacterium immunditiarum]NYE20506.1 flagellar biosynthesis/type III secretory pathway M-ring protein FliF/YscJ [Microbacterium immunditiarum]
MIGGIDVTSEVAQISAALIAAVAAIVAAIVTAIIAPRIRRDTQATRAQVENDHPRNLREELDERHHETRGWFRTLYRIVGGLAVAVAGVIGAVTLNHTRLVRVETHLKGHRR